MIKPTVHQNPRSKQWFVIGLPESYIEGGRYGPYETKKEADEARLGAVRFFRINRDETKKEKRNVRSPR